MSAGIQDTVKSMKVDKAKVTVYCEPAGIHAWPVVDLFLGNTREERLKGLNLMTDQISTEIGRLTRIASVEDEQTKDRL